MKIRMLNQGNRNVMHVSHGKVIDWKGAYYITIICDRPAKKKNQVPVVALLTGRLHWLHPEELVRVFPDATVYVDHEPD